MVPPEVVVPPESAQEPAQYNRSLFDACPDPLLVVAVNRRITDANGAFLRVTGIRREKLIGSDFASCFTDLERARGSTGCAAK